jgi:hypothetical protein
MESKELKDGRFVMTWKLKTTRMCGSIMVEGNHEGDDDADYLFEHKHHKIQQNPSKLQNVLFFFFFFGPLLLSNLMTLPTKQHKMNLLGV